MYLLKTTIICAKFLCINQAERYFFNHFIHSKNTLPYNNKLYKGSYVYVLLFYLKYKVSDSPKIYGSNLEADISNVVRESLIYFHKDIHVMITK